MIKLLRETLTDCLSSGGHHEYAVDTDNYHFEIVSTDTKAALNIYIDYGFGGDHCYELLQKDAKICSKKSDSMYKFVVRILKFIESYPAKNPLDRDALFAKYEAKMEKDYRKLLRLSDDINSVADLYDLLINEPAGTTYRLILPKTGEAEGLMLFADQTGGNLNEEHLRRQGIIKTPEDGDYSDFFYEHRDQCVFGDACTNYCEDLNTEEHPIPWLFYLTFNDRERYNDVSNGYMHDIYIKVLNYLAVKENRKLLDSMTPDNIPEVFHNVDDYYNMPLNGDYYERFDYKVQLPDTKDFNVIKDSIRKELIEHNLI